MSRHVVLGDGVAGRHHQRVLLGRGRTVAAVLDQRHGGFEAALAAAIAGESEAIWHICTPTDSHLHYASRLLAARPEAKIILEKPIGLPRQRDAFRRLARDRNVVVQSQFSHAGVVGLLGEVAARRWPHGPLRLDLSFAKLRAGGRFEDRHRRAIGYEGFHQFAIILRLVERLRGKEAATAFACRARTVEATNGDSGYFIRARFGEIAVSLSSALDSEPRRASVTVQGQGGCAAVLHVETSDWYTGAPRQTHCVWTGDLDAVVEEDLMETGVEACIAALVAADREAIAADQRRAVTIEALLDRGVRCAANRTLSESPPAEPETAG